MACARRSLSNRHPKTAPKRICPINAPSESHTPADVSNLLWSRDITHRQGSQPCVCVTWAAKSAVDSCSQKRSQVRRLAAIDRQEGPKTIESMYEEYLYIPVMLEAAMQAEREGYEAVITGCAGDPGLDAARELVRIPVTGPGESGMLLATLLGYRYSVITILDNTVRSTYELAHKVGVTQKLASVRAIGQSVEEVRKGAEFDLPGRARAWPWPASSRTTPTY